MTDFDPSQSIEDYLVAHQNKELLRFVSVGSVDDGKSTLIGRLLHDTHGVYEDQLSAVKRASAKGSIEIDFSLFTDGLKAEREQGITIDVAYRYFSTAKRKFIIADTPGHVQYTRNMATGASTANVAIILIDARLGVLQQSRRHAYIASLLGIPHLLVAVNKMDLKGFSQDVFEHIKRDFERFARRLAFREVKFLPISALEGDNVVHPSHRMPWHADETLLGYLESVEVSRDRNFENLRFPIQLVLRPNLDYRAFAGEVASGVVRKGDEVLVLPSRRTSRVVAIDTFEGEIDEAFPPMSVALRLADEVDVSRGDMLVHPTDLPAVENQFTAMMVWLGERPLDTGRTYLLKQTTRTVRAEVHEVQYKVDLESLDHTSAPTLELNDIGCVGVRTHQPIFFDAYDGNRATGAFILVDSVSNNTVAAGMIRPLTPAAAGLGPDLRAAVSQVSSTERQERIGQSGFVVAITGLPAAGKTSVAYALERRLFDRGVAATVIDAHDASAGAAIRDPGATAEMVNRLAGAGLAVVVAAPFAQRSERKLLRDGAGSAFTEVHLATSEADCRARDERGNFDARADEYEAPDAPEVRTALEAADAEQCAGTILAHLESRGLVGPRRTRGGI